MNVGYKFEPKLSYREIGNGQVEMHFRWRQRQKDAQTKLVVDMTCFQEFQKFAETPTEKRFEHLGNALNWDAATEYSELIVFLIDLLLYFPFAKTVQFRRIR